MACCSANTKPSSPMGQGKSVIAVPVTIAPSTASNYTDGDSCGGLLEFPCAIGDLSGSATLKQIQLIEKAASGSALKYAMDLVLLAGSGYSVADNAPFVASTADLMTGNYILGHYAIVTGDYFTVGSGTTHAEVLKTSKDFGDWKVYKSGMIDTAATSSTSIYGYLIWRGGANDYAASASLKLILTFERD